MKHLSPFICLLFAQIGITQTNFPDFLHGTWKIEGKEIYEHWDKLSDQTLKGFSYKIEDGQMVVSEYIDITRQNDEVFYIATVRGQNQGQAIKFKLTKVDSSYTFENLNHDFPKKIVYQKSSDDEIIARVSDGKGKGFEYNLRKQNTFNTVKDTTTSNPKYNGDLAHRLGADDYGMKNYIFVILKTGPNTTTDQEFISESFRGHLANINRLAEQGKLIVAGPLGKNDKQYRGIFILDKIANVEDAVKLLQTDPAIKKGLLEADIFPWYGSAALPEYLPISDRIWKVKP